LGAAIPPIMPVILGILAIFTNVTVIQRIFYARQYLQKNGLTGKEGTDAKS
jgi:hypothetical protein